MCSILLVFAKNFSNDPVTTKNQQTFYSELETLTKQNKAVELLEENTLLIKLNDSSSLYMLHKILSVAGKFDQNSYKHAVLPIEIEWHDLKEYLQNKNDLNAAFR